MSQPDADSDTERRRAIIDSARASVEAEGLVPSTAFDADSEAYVTGTLSADELVARAEARYSASAPDA